ncbi:MAG TPA: GNAT family N-acetyltransferase [Frankiaceae bacterium]|nr:GNAT family N-acetyltransferase [Frankiaceae bacterium]
MARAVARARAATAADVPAVLDLFDELQEASTRTSSATRGVNALPGVDHRADAELRYRAALDDVDARLFVAVVDDAGPSRAGAIGGEATGRERIVGMVLCTVTGSGTFVDAPIVQMNHFFVVPVARRRGAGRVLVAAATAWAEQRGLDGLGVAVYPDSREANRYFARLGFSPVYVHRVAPLAGLKRVLGSAVPAAARQESAHGARRRLRIGITGSRAVVRTRRYPV